MNSAIGIIGIGNMGGMIAEQFVTIGAVKEQDLYLCDLDKDKMDRIKDKYLLVNTFEDSEELAKECRYIIISVEPPHIPAVIKRIAPNMCGDVNLFISSSNIKFDSLRKLYPGKVTKFLPTLNCMINRGVILACHNNLVTEEEQNFFADIFGKICAHVRIIAEKDFALINNLTGCAPAFIAYIFDTLVKAAAEFHPQLPTDELSKIMMETLYATGRLFMEKNISFENTLKYVGSPGGITYRALSALQETLPHAFRNLCERSIERHHWMDDRVDGAIKEQLDN